MFRQKMSCPQRWLNSLRTCSYLPTFRLTVNTSDRISSPVYGAICTWYQWGNMTLTFTSWLWGGLVVGKTHDKFHVVWTEMQTMVNSDANKSSYNGRTVCLSVIPSGALYDARSRSPTPAFDSTDLRNVTFTIDEKTCFMFFIKV